MDIAKQTKMTEPSQAHPNPAKTVTTRFGRTVKVMATVDYGISSSETSSESDEDSVEELNMQSDDAKSSSPDSAHSSVDSDAEVEPKAKVNKRVAPAKKSIVKRVKPEPSVTTTQATKNCTRPVQASKNSFRPPARRLSPDY